MHKKTQQGFTLIELVMVIVILGILAATALPRFVNLGGDARAAAINGLAGGVRSAVTIAQARYAATGNMTATSVDLQGQTVTVAAGSGLPVSSAAGIEAAMQDIGGFTVVHTAATTSTFSFAQNPSATCQAVYTAATGAVAVVSSGC